MSNTNTNATNKAYTSIVNGETFNMTPTYAEMDQQVLMHLADQMFRALDSPVNMNQEVSCILQMEHHLDVDLLPYTSDDITNNEPTANLETLEAWEELTETQKDELVEEYQEKLESLDDETEEYDHLDSVIDSLNGAEFYDYPEIMQWFLIDDRILSRLEEMGECTLDDRYWGRQAYGQSITMDTCIMKACYDLAMCWKQEVKPLEPTKQPINSFNDCK